ncbi:TetR/AcrR family transcriptional regulator [Nocardioides sp. SYSU D00038]|uniref:TetR/AcrR family transcriptional regulator n=1 Tax=Nocardioides sp. SYSU D00038 TaxID=2812554 RepID=UPI0019677AE9|nr:TetR/AcrR family transcriptional regulator [Nocardioides sp. SYSU D00038]
MDHRGGVGVLGRNAHEDGVPDRATVPTSRAQRTREALREAAVRHFLRDGFDKASVPAIAAEVGVTERTFYRHFATKDEVLFADLTERLAWFHDALRGRPVDEDLADSVLTALASAPTDAHLVVEIARLRTQLLSHERIESAYRNSQTFVAGDVRAVLRERGADDLDAAVRAELVAGAVFAALMVWTEGPGPHDLDSLVRLTADALSRVRPALAG